MHQGVPFLPPCPVQSVRNATVYMFNRVTHGRRMRVRLDPQDRAEASASKPVCKPFLANWWLCVLHGPWKPSRLHLT